MTSEESRKIEAEDSADADRAIADHPAVLGLFRVLRLARTMPATNAITPEAHRQLQRLGYANPNAVMEVLSARGVI